MSRTYYINRYHQRIQAGLCGRCGNEKEYKEKSCCESCNEYNKIKDRKRYKKLKNDLAYKKRHAKYGKKWRKLNPLRNKEIQKIWRSKHPEKIKEYRRRFNRRYPEYYKHYASLSKQKAIEYMCRIDEKIRIGILKGL